MRLVEFLKRKYVFSGPWSEVDMESLTMEDLDEYLEAREEALVRKISDAIKGGLEIEKINGLPEVPKRKV